MAETACWDLVYMLLDLETKSKSGKIITGDTCLLFYLFFIFVSGPSLALKLIFYCILKHSFSFKKNSPEYKQA